MGVYLPRTLGASFAGDQAKGRRAAFDSFDFGFIGRGVDPYLEDGEGAKRSGGPEVGCAFARCLFDVWRAVTLRAKF
jgi:hypothetical protein